MSEKENIHDFGHFLSHPLPGDEVVISGMSGKFAESQNVHEFRDNLYNKLNMTKPNRRFNLVHPDIPEVAGHIPHITKFDSGFFGMSNRQSNDSDAMVRMLLEVTTEAIFDAGYQLADLEYTKTGVFVGFSFLEAEVEILKKKEPGCLLLTGATRSMFSNRLSYIFKWNGPSKTIDTACSSSLYALREAFIAIRKGECDRAIVAGCQLCLNPTLTIQFGKLGVLSKKCKCRPFDVDSDGYIRSETVSVVFLEKAKFSKRVYANIIHCKGNFDGFKLEGISFPSAQDQAVLLKEFYMECGVDPKEVNYVELHGTGTKAGDPQEIKAIDSIFGKANTTSPLLIGSVKSNMGHSEAASGLNSLIKVILAFETGQIAPNLNFECPREECVGILKGRLKVVQENTSLSNSNGLIGLCNYGFGGANCHALLKWNHKNNINNEYEEDNMPKVICVSGRTEEAVHTLLDDVLYQKVNREHVRLLQDVFRKEIPNHQYRGYSLVLNQTEVERSVNFYSKTKSSFYIGFGLVDQSLLKLGQQLKKIPVLYDIIKSIQGLLEERGINVASILHCSSADMDAQTIINGVVIQILVIEFLKVLDIKPKKVFGTSIGALVCAYYDDVLTLEETLEYVCIFAQSVEKNAPLTENKMQFSASLNDILRNTKEYNVNKSFFRKNKGVMCMKATILELGNKLNLSTNLKCEKLLVHQNNNNLFKLIGRLYELGHDPQLYKIYTKVTFPVTRGTPMISPKVRWNHKRDFFVVDKKVLLSNSTKNCTVFNISLAQKSWSYLSGHIVDGRNIFPGTGYLYLVWKALANQKALTLHETLVKFENCKFIRVCTIPKPEHTKPLKLSVTIQRGSNTFEVLESKTLLVTGTVKIIENNAQSWPDTTSISSDSNNSLYSEDIYKELGLRGYSYKGSFKNLREFSPSQNYGKILWCNNFVIFMDNMLQMLVLQEDTRHLKAPLHIRSITIDGLAHMKYINRLMKKHSKNDDVLLPATISTIRKSVRSGFVEIVGLTTANLVRKKQKAPILETYEFIPNQSKLSLTKAVRVNIQIMLENAWAIKNKVIELVEKNSNVKLTPIIKNVFDDSPTVQLEIIIREEVNNLDNDCTLIVGSSLLQRKNILNKLLTSLKQTGFIMSREPLRLDTNSLNFENLTILTIFTTDAENLVLLRRRLPDKTNSALLNISVQNKNFSWLPKLKEAVKSQSGLIIYSENETTPTGIIGLANTLRKEICRDDTQCFLVTGNTPKFDINHEFYSRQLNKGMTINVYKDGVWGTYRRLILEQSNVVEHEHCYATNLLAGDFSSLKWVQGRLTTHADSDLVRVYYSAINFKDVMVTSGKIGVDVETIERRHQDCVIGSEFSGTLIKSGKRVMGLKTQGAMSTLVKPDSNLLWEVPDSWGLEDAATVPIVYTTVIYALHEIANIKPTDSILIHCGTGGVGQAAINLCLHMGCNIFVTVGTQEKRDFIKQRFPTIKESHIGNSRNLSFEQMIKRMTYGRGVDVVLNSLSGQKLIASVRCLAEGGRFLEIGKYDLIQNSFLNMTILNKNISFYGVMLDKVFTGTESMKKRIFEMVNKGIKEEYVKPLVRTVFQVDEIENAFRFMGIGNHIGKLLLILQKEENQKLCLPVVQKLKGLPRYYCSPTKSYVVCGGLGGFALEFVDWMILRGAKKIILVSKRGITNGYQAHRLKIWKSYGCNIIVSTLDTASEEGCESVLNLANSLGPVDGVFNFAVNFRDAIIENQTEESFKSSFLPKAFVTENLDRLTRKLCPELKTFVVISSAVTSIGNTGQTNYGMSNNIMEEICESRRLEGLPGLAIEWGAIADVGILLRTHEDPNSMQFCGTSPQSVSSCLQVLDILLTQRQSTIVCSMVIADKSCGRTTFNILEQLAHILGIRDMKTIRMNLTLAEHGMDSITAIEIKQLLETELDMMFSVDEIRLMTFASVLELQTNEDSKETSSVPTFEENTTILRFFDSQAYLNVPIHRLPSLQSPSQSVCHQKIIVFPGIFGTTQVLIPLTEKIDADIYGIEYCINNQKDTINEMVNDILPLVLEQLSCSEPFHLICYSFGSLIAFEVCYRLEKLGYRGKLISLDGTPDLIKQMLTIFQFQHDEEMFNRGITYLLGFLLSSSDIAKYEKKLNACVSLEDKVNLFKTIISKKTSTSLAFDLDRIKAWFKKIKCGLKYQPVFANKIESPVALIKPTVPTVAGLAADYGLSNICSNVTIQTFQGNHMNIVENSQVIDAVLKLTNSCNI